MKLRFCSSPHLSFYEGIFLTHLDFWSHILFSPLFHTPACSPAVWELFIYLFVYFCCFCFCYFAVLSFSSLLVLLKMDILIFYFTFAFHNFKEGERQLSHFYTQTGKRPWTFIFQIQCEQSKGLKPWIWWKSSKGKQYVTYFPEHGDVLKPRMDLKYSGYFLGLSLGQIISPNLISPTKGRISKTLWQSGQPKF